MNKGYVKFENVILTDKKFIINILKDFEDLEIEFIEKTFKSKIIITYHNNFWTILCKVHKALYIVEKSLFVTIY